MDNSTIKKIGLASLLSIGLNAAFAHGDHSAPVSKSAIHFFTNKGQWNTDAKFKANLPGGDMYIADYGLIYNYVNVDDLNKAHDLVVEGKDADNYMINYHAYKVNFIGANKNITYKSENQSKEYYNFILGNDPSKWASYVYGYNVVTQENIYNKVDVKYSSKDAGSYKYDFIVKPGGNPSDITLGFDGVKPKINNKGELEIDLKFTKIIESAPYTYQIIDGKEVFVASKFKILDGVLKFDLPNGYNTNYDLIIDPSVVYATFSGAVANAHYAHSTTYDNQGNTYACALAGTANWPTTVGAYQLANASGNSVGLHKYSSDGSQLIYGTYFGGASGSTLPHTARVNEDGEICLAGPTNSATVPMLATSYDNTLTGTGDLYLAILSTDGATLLASTYLGGTGNEGMMPGATTAPSGNMSANLNGLDIVFDNNGDLWVGSSTTSTDFPVTPNALQATLSGSSDMVMVKLDKGLTTLMYSTYYGGSGYEGIHNVEMNQDGSKVYFAGHTNSPNFPVTAGVLGSTAFGGRDGAVVGLDNTTYARIAASYFGTAGEDEVTKLDFDCADNLYLCGRNSIGAYPVDANYVNANGKVFVHKVNGSLNQSFKSGTYGAASGSQIPMGFMVDVCGNVFITMVSSSGIAGLPVTPDAIDATPRSFYMIVLEPNLHDLYFGTYYGSPSGDHSHPGIHRLDSEGFSYASVCGTNATFPTTPGSWSQTKMNGGTNDNIAFKFDFDAAAVKVRGESPEGGYNDATHAIRGCKSAYLHYEMSPPDERKVVRLEILGDAVNGTDYTFIADSLVFNPGDTLKTIEIKALRVPQATGTRRVIINTFSTCACDGNADNIVSSDTVLIIDSVYVNMPRSFGYTCPADSINIGVTIDPTLDYTWEPRNLIDQYVGQGIKVAPTVTTQYTVTASQPGAPTTCPSRSATYTAYVEPNPIISFPVNPVTVCLVDSYALNVYVQPGGQDYDYTWSPNTYISNPKDPNTKFAAPVGNYKMYVNVKTPRAGCSSDDTLDITVVPPFMFSQVKPEDTLIRLGETVQLDVIGDAVMWVWSPVDYIADPMVKNPLVKPDTSMRYRVVGWDKYGCTDTAYANVRVEHKSNIFIPNAFSPNGDGLNDIFKIQNITYERLQILRIVNRWGEVVFETQDPTKGWDGNIDGKPAPTDVYYYHITMTPPIGKDDIKITGDVTLTR